MRYSSISNVITLHAEIRNLYNQTSLLRDKGEAGIESAIMRPQMAEYYESADLAKQAALLILGIAQAHPFVDGNKRVALAAGDVMIQLNGYMVHSQSKEFARQIVAAIIGSNKGENAVEALADWLRSKMQPLSVKP